MCTHKKTYNDSNGVEPEDQKALFSSNNIYFIKVNLYDKL